MKIIPVGQRTPSSYLINCLYSAVISARKCLFLILAFSILMVSVSIIMGYGLESRGSISGRGKEYFYTA
jgi:hypothetical protein